MLQLGDTKLFYRSCRSIFNEGKEKCKLHISGCGQPCELPHGLTLTSSVRLSMQVKHDLEGLPPGSKFGTGLSVKHEITFDMALIRN